MKRLKIGIQKSGRLSEASVQTLRSTGLIFADYKKQLIEPCKNAAIEIVYMRDDDIPTYVANGALDIGIVGKNVLLESAANVSEITQFEFGSCSLAVAVPVAWKSESLESLQNCRIATSYPRITRMFFEGKNISVVIVNIAGSAESTVKLGLADAIVDIVSTGDTLRANGLRVLKEVCKSKAVLIANRNVLSNTAQKDFIQQFFFKKRMYLSQIL
jgi:ATP phosphoribosyltransferase